MKVDLTKKSPYNEPATAGSMFEGRGLPLFLDDLAVLDLPEEGCVTFKYKKGPVTATESSGDAPARASATLRLLEICACEAEDVEDKEEDDEYEGDADKSIDELFEEASSDISEDEVED
jgi:hypothetical protein